MNKIIVSIFLTIVLILGINKITDVIYYVEKPEKSSYQVDGLEATVSKINENSRIQLIQTLEILWQYLLQQVPLKVQKFLKNALPVIA